jgi:hypothetical protein
MILFFQEKLAKLFPTIVSNARTVKVFNAGAPGNRNGALQAVCLITSSKLIFLFLKFYQICNYLRNFILLLVPTKSSNHMHLFRWLEKCTSFHPWYHLESSTSSVIVDNLAIGIG